jgi:hypothetical protein
MRNLCVSVGENGWRLLDRKARKMVVIPIKHDKTRYWRFNQENLCLLMDAFRDIISHKMV